MRTSRLTQVFVAAIGVFGALSMPARVDAWAIGPKASLSHANPTDIVVGSDGNLWASEETGPSPFFIGAIARITPSGVVTEYGMTSPGPFGMTLASDGSVWFTGYGTSQIGRITPAGGVYHYNPYQLTGTPRWICAGPDKNVWFTDPGTNTIGGITPGTLATFNINTIPTSNAGLYGITAGPDGALWFTEATAGKIGRTDLEGNVTEYPLADSGAEPTLIVAGPDGALWFTEGVANKIGRITTGGEITEYDIPTASSNPFGITVGNDGNLYFTEENSGKIELITPDGTITEFTGVDNSMPTGIVNGPVGYLWFLDAANNQVDVYRPTWVPQQTMLAPDGTSRLLLTTSSGLAYIWFMDANGNHTSSTPAFSDPGYTVKSMSVGPGNTMDLLWTNPAGAAAYWRLNSAGAVTSRTTIPVN